LVPDEAKDMFDHLLVLDPKKCMDATKVLKHKWLSKEFSLLDQRPNQSTADALTDNLMNYKETTQLKTIALNVSYIYVFWFLIECYSFISSLLLFLRSLPTNLVGTKF
jgi:hypothetical protein